MLSSIGIADAVGEQAPRDFGSSCFCSGKPPKARLLVKGPPPRGFRMRRTNAQTRGLGGSSSMSDFFRFSLLLGFGRFSAAIAAGAAHAADLAEQEGRSRRRRSLRPSPGSTSRSASWHDRLQLPRYLADATARRPSRAASNCSSTNNQFYAGVYGSERRSGHHVRMLRSTSTAVSVRSSATSPSISVSWQYYIAPVKRSTSTPGAPAPPSTGRRRTPTSLEVSGEFSYTTPEAADGRR